MNQAKFVIQVSKGLIRHQRARRLMMFYSVIAALLLLFTGSTLLWPFLREHPFFFLAYWFICAWITLLVVLLALYDIVRVRAEARHTRRTLEQEYLEKTKRDPEEGDSP